MDERKERGVVLPSGHTGSSLFHRVLREAEGAFGDVLGPARLPETPGAFKREYGAALARFEAERSASPRREEIARFIARRTQEELMFSGDSGEQPLAEHMAKPAPAPALQRQALPGAPGLRAEVPLDGTVYRGREVIELAERLAAERHLTQPVIAALRFIIDHIEAHGGALDLRGERFVILGAGAELAPSRMLLQAGAQVLWVDLAEPTAALGDMSAFAGTLVRAPGASNLLEAPREIAAAIRAFAADGPVHLAMFAYASGSEPRMAPGRGHERDRHELAAAADPFDLAARVAYDVRDDPARERANKPSAATPSDRSGRARCTRRPVAGARPLLGARRAHRAVHGVDSRPELPGGAIHLEAGERRNLRVARHRPRADTPRPTTVSANVAGITRTRSLSHPLFEAAFIGAPRFGVRIFDPATTRALSGLLILHDLLNPSAPGAAARQTSDPRDKAKALFAQQVHGGIYSLPFVLEHAIRAAAVIGMSKKPALLFRR